MEGTVFLQLTVYGLMLGVTYILVASGFTMIFSVCNILSFAHGEIYCMGAIGIYFMYQVAGLNFFLSLFVIMLVFGFLGVGIEKFFLAPIRIHESATVIVSLAVGWILTGSALVLGGETDHGVTSPFPGVVKLFGVGASNEGIAINIISIILIAGLYFLIQWTKLGQALRAMAQNKEAAALVGISADRMSALAFGIGSALAAVAGGLLASVYVVNPFLGWPALFKCMIVVIIGGLGSIPGVVAGGLVLGFVDSFGPGLFGGASDMIGFILVIAVLVFKPKGLFGRG
jgi:branched-chain amino acid transport system permease protein